MPPVTLLVPDLGYNTHARQVSLLAPALKAAGRDVTVFSLNGDGPLRPVGVPIEGRSGRRHGYLDDWRALRRRLRAGPVHAFGLATLRALHIVGLGWSLPPVVLALTGRERFGWLDSRWARRTKRILVPHAAAADAVTRQGIPTGLIEVVPLAVGEAPPPPDRGEFCQALGFLPDAPLFVTAGWMNRRADLFEAVWAFEFLRYPMDTARLLVIGDGPGREPTEQGALGLAPEGSRVHFLGARPDAPSLLGLADVVIVAQPTGGANVALEAMAASRPVAAVRTLDLAAVIRDGETGVLGPARFAPELARAIRRLLDDPARMRQLAEAGRAYVRERHSVSAIIRQLESVYGG